MVQLSKYYLIGNAMTQVQTNPCAICRVAGFLVCKGHGRSGEDSGQDEAASGVSEDSSTATSLQLVLKESPFWSQSDDEENTFEYDNPEALISIRLTMDMGSIVISPKSKKLLEKEWKSFEQFFEAVISTFMEFMAGLIGGDLPMENELTLAIPVPNTYDAFIKRLIAKNLLMMQQPAPILNKSLEKAPLEESLSIVCTAPTPFDMNGPKRV